MVIRRRQVALSRPQLKPISIRRAIPRKVATIASKPSCNGFGIRWSAGSARIATRSRERRHEVLLVVHRNQRQLFGIRSRRLAIDPRARQSDQRTLPPCRQIGTVARDHRRTRRRKAWPDGPRLPQLRARRRPARCGPFHHQTINHRRPARPLPAHRNISFGEKLRLYYPRETSKRAQTLLTGIIPTTAAWPHAASEHRRGFGDARCRLPTLGSAHQHIHLPVPHREQTSRSHQSSIVVGAPCRACSTKAWCPILPSPHSQPDRRQPASSMGRAILFRTWYGQFP